MPETQKLGLTMRVHAPSSLSREIPDERRGREELRLNRSRSFLRELRSSPKTGDNDCGITINTITRCIYVSSIRIWRIAMDRSTQKVRLTSSGLGEICSCPLHISPTCQQRSSQFISNDALATGHHQHDRNMQESGEVIQGPAGESTRSTNPDRWVLVRRQVTRASSASSTVAQQEDARYPTS